MGIVYLAEDLLLERNVAIKCLKSDPKDSQSHSHRLTLEAKAASALNHPNVCTVYEFGLHDEDVPFIAMEFIQGQTLRSRLLTDPVTIPQAIDIAIQVTDALAAAHEQGIIHRDIKPSNICLTLRGQAKVLDFGIAKRIEPSSPDDATKLGLAVGTIGYSSPEQLLAQAVDSRTDIYSLGVVLYEMLTLQNPIKTSSKTEAINKTVEGHFKPVLELNPSVPAELQSIVERCIHTEPEHRFTSCAELLQALRKLTKVVQTSTSTGPDPFPTVGQVPKQPSHSFDTATTGSLQDELVDARHGGMAALRAFKQRIQPALTREPRIGVELLLAFRAFADWSAMIDLVEDLPPTIATSELVQQQYALALNRTGADDQAEAILRELLQTKGETSETLGLLGRVYKDRWEQACCDGQTTEALGLLAQAADTYLKGFEKDWRDTYPGINAAMLLTLCNPSDERVKQILPVIKYGIDRRIREDDVSYWDYATLLEIAVLERDDNSLRTLIPSLFAAEAESWQRETTFHNLDLYHQSRSLIDPSDAWLSSTIETLRREFAAHAHPA